ncbi:MAG: hypothetical protein JXQ90_03245 [Cyclobacteriaceae bacterium]
MLICLLGAYNSTAQSNLQCKTIQAGVPFLLDTLVIDAASIQIDPQSTFQFDPETNLLLVDAGIDSVKVCFRSLSPMILKEWKLRDPSIYEPRSFATGLRRTEVLSNTDQSTSNIYKAGAISRGITVGNRQDLFVNSTLNLQLAGQLSEQLQIEATITDQNVPYQPEGNTQNIRDFDRVLIRLFNEGKFELSAGDIISRSSEELHYLKFYKNLMGGQVKNTFMLGNGQYHSRVSAGVGKGKFASITIAPIESVQGPYKLTVGQEQFVIVLASSEKVYIDGKLLERGFDNDYVIDYNLGEIVFNASVMITRFTRIRVDFEYLQRHFNRYNIQTSQRFDHERGHLSVNYYSEKDQSNSTFIKYSQDQLTQLGMINSDFDNAFLSGIDSAGFALERIMYAKKDTLVNGVAQTYYKVSTDPSQANYALTFKEVGTGNGNYILSGSNENGRVYQWVAPGNGLKNGNYEPLEQVILPNKKNMITIDASHQLGSFFTLKNELAISNQDQNLYAGGVTNQNGFANKTALDLKEVSSFRNLKGGVSYEYVQRAFLPIDRFRFIEFDRDWNYLSPTDSVNQDEHIGKVYLNIGQSGELLDYQGTYRNRLTALKGFQHQVNGIKKIGAVHFKANYYQMKNIQALTDNSWTRGNGEIGVQIGKLITGVNYGLDHNQTKNLEDELVSSLMYFDQYGWFVRNADSTRFSLQGNAIRRMDKLPLTGVLVDYTDANQFGIAFNTPPASDQTLKLNLNYRMVDNLLDSINGSQNNVQGRLVSTNSLFKRAIRSNLSYAIQNARQLRQSFVYTQVGSGLGTHTWRDENQNGVQELDEFYIAINQDERNFIKLFVPSSDYVEAYQTIYVHSIDASFPKSLRMTGYLGKQVKKLSLSINYNINSKTTNNDVIARMNPFVNQTNDGQSFGNKSKRYNLFYNRNGTGISALIRHQTINRNHLNERGYDGNEMISTQYKLRYNQRKFQASIMIEEGRRSNFSDFLKNRNIDLSTSDYAGEGVWMINNSLRINTGIGYRFKSSIESPEHFSKIKDVSIGSTFNNSSSGSLNAKMNLTTIDFSGEAGSFLGYTLLEALQPGFNTLINVNWQQQFSNGLQFTIQYFGRNSTNSQLIHSGTMQLTAFF